MTLENKMCNFREANQQNYLELKNYSNSEKYEYFVGCGGLYLATNMVRKMNLKKGDIVLDLGSGFGSTSLFLAKEFDVTVISVDLWFSPTKLLESDSNASFRNKIRPMCIDITSNIPFDENYFDAIFCMNSLFMFGDNYNFLSKLFNTLKTGGTFCIGSECFNEEPTYKNLSDVPGAYNFEWKWKAWENCFSRYHSPNWWKMLVESTNLIEITYCAELEDGIVLWEDLARNYYNYFNENILSMGAMIPQEKIVDAIIYGKENMPYPTLFVLSGLKK